MKITKVDYKLYLTENRFVPSRHDIDGVLIFEFDFDNDPYQNALFTLDVRFSCYSVKDSRWEISVAPARIAWSLKPSELLLVCNKIADVCKQLEELQAKLDECNDFNQSYETAITSLKSLKY